MNDLGNFGEIFPDIIDNDLLFAGFIAISVLCVLMIFVLPAIDARERVRKRAGAIGARLATTAPQNARTASELQKRRKIIAESLQDVANRNEQKKKLNLDVRIVQAGLDMSPTVFMCIAVGCGVVSGIIYYLMTDQVLVAGGIVITLVFGAPNWILNYLRTRRINKFVLNFPPALETIVRGVRAGLPLNDCFTVIASEAQEPVRSEFRILIEALAVGLTLGEATERMAERIPTPETTFFSIVLAIQEKTGGNLGETLANLSNVLRDRKKLKEKVRALASEATASAAIIGSMPILVILAVYVTTPDYLTILFATSAGKMILGGGVLWMMMGAVIMRQMINFDI